MDAVLDALENPIAIAAADGRLLKINRAFRSSFLQGLDLPAGGGLPAGIDLPALREALRADSLPAQVEFEFLRGVHRLVYRVKVVPIHYGERDARLLKFQDITEIRRLQAVRRDFVANVSHQLKTPLTSIIGYLETLLTRPGLPEEKKREFLKRIAFQTRRMESLVLDLIQLSELESGKTLNKKPFRLKDLFREVQEQSEVKARQKGLSLRFVLPRKTVRLLGDFHRLREALENLVQNAIQYTPRDGEIAVYIEPLADNRVKICVRDTGIGVEPKFQQRIFQRFYRVDSARKMHAGGTGLGLAIVKHILEAHGQEVGVDSAPGKGSVFWMTVERADSA